MAPIFDNATSLGYEQTSAHLAKPWSDDRIFRYIEKGTHHCSWLAEERRGMQHMKLCAQFCEAHAAASADMKNVIRLADSEIEATFNWCTEFDVPFPFDAARAAFASTLVKARRDTIARSLGD
jgi:hypothetical protein